jgi:orotidine-5'-phosphate decarboxylase
VQFVEKLRRLSREKRSLVCVGLDTVPEKIPGSLRGTDRVFEFNKAIIESTCDSVLAFKPNLAFYEALGTEGWNVLKRTVKAIPDDVIKIGDGKRGDIGNTAERYAKALYDIGFDAVTVNPYMGWDSVSPFVADEQKGAFILCLTSNPSAKDFQYIKSDGKLFYQQIAEKTVQWNTKGNCGLVIGATRPEELAAIRKIAPNLPFLIPGIGAQGGDLESTVLEGTDAAGELYASSGPDFAEAAGREAADMRDRINAIRRKKAQA